MWRLPIQNFNQLSPEIWKLKTGICYRQFPGYIIEGRTESHEQPFFACKPGTADEGE